MDTPEETNIRARAAESARDSTGLVLGRLRGISEGRSPYWEPGDNREHLELAGTAARVAGDKELADLLLAISREVSEEPNESRAREVVARLDSLAKSAWDLALQLNPHLR